MIAFIVVTTIVAIVAYLIGVFVGYRCGHSAGWDDREDVMDCL